MCEVTKNDKKPVNYGRERNAEAPKQDFVVLNKIRKKGAAAAEQSSVVGSMVRQQKFAFVVTNRIPREPSNVTLGIRRQLLCQHKKNRKGNIGCSVEQRNQIDVVPSGVNKSLCLKVLLHCNTHQKRTESRPNDCASEVALPIQFQT